MKIVSFNVNGLRARLHQLEAVINKHAPDIIGLQETKVDDDQFPAGAIESLGYGVIYHGQKGHYGVALLYRLKLCESMCGFPDDTDGEQRRLVAGLFEYNGEKIRVINGYFPQGENRDHPEKFPNKAKFYAKLGQYLSRYCDTKEQLLIMGDMNIAPQDADIGIGLDNMKRWLRTGKCCFLPEEREWFQGLISWGLTDTFRHFNPENRQDFSWFDYRSRGFEQDPRRGLRIDLLLASDSLLEKASDSGIDYEIRAMDKPSDHCPVWLDIKA
ncbi:MAG: exodeoxyribonuclease III [Porticoccaceae bacterium]|nr:exodeoxyribonuclease III [Pseudomonadales bacterium]MCP5171666.1 exodeoxyribonuclease III [Pseudomonadales bacterium]